MHAVTSGYFPYFQPEINEKEKTYKSSKEFVDHVNFLNKTNNIFTNRQNVNQTFNELKEGIEELLKENYDGFHDGVPGPTYSGIKFWSIFQFDASSKQDWTMKLNSESQILIHDEYNNQKALELFNTYISLEFKDKIESIRMDNEYIYIKWKI